MSRDPYGQHFSQIEPCPCEFDPPYTINVCTSNTCRIVLSSPCENRTHVSRLKTSCPATRRMGHVKVGYPGVEPEPFGSQNRRASICTSTRNSYLAASSQRLVPHQTKKDSMPHVATSSLLDNQKKDSTSVTTDAKRLAQLPGTDRAVPSVQVVVWVVE